MQSSNRDRPVVQRVAHLYEHWSSLPSREESWTIDRATHLPHLKTGGRDLRSDQRPRFSFASLRYLVHTSLFSGARSVIFCNRKAGRGQAGEVLLVHQEVSHPEIFVHQVQPVQSTGAGSSLCCGPFILTGERVYFPSSLKYNPSTHKVSCKFLLFSNFIH